MNFYLKSIFQRFFSQRRIFGKLDYPSIECASVSSVLEIKGWAFANGNRRIKGFSYLNGIKWGEFIPSIDRPDIKKAYQKIGAPRISGFTMPCNWAEISLSRGNLTVELFCEGGEKLLLGPVSISSPPIIGHCEYCVSENAEGEIALKIKGRAFAADGMPVTVRLSAKGIEQKECYASLPHDASLKNPAARFSGFAFSIPLAVFYEQSENLQIDLTDHQGHTLSLTPSKISDLSKKSSKEINLIKLLSGGVEEFTGRTGRKLLRPVVRPVKKMICGDQRGMMELRAPLQYFIDHIVVEGWVYSSDPKPLVKVFVDNKCVHSFYPSFPRKDVEKYPPEIYGGKGMGFSEWINIRDFPKKHSSLKTQIMNRAGKRLKLGSQKISPLPEVEEGFYGELEGPLEGAEIKRSLLPVKGWALFSDGPPIKGEIFINSKYSGELELCKRRDDLFPLALSIPSFGFSGFQALVGLSGLSEGPFDITLRFKSEKGLEKAFPPLRLYYNPKEGEDKEEIPPGFKKKRDRKDQDDYSPIPFSSKDYTCGLKGHSLRICAATHNFNIEGAPLYLYNLFSYLAKTEKIDGSVFSPSPGVLQDWYKGEGFKADIMDQPVAQGVDRRVYDEAVNRGCRILKEGGYQLAIANTLESFWMVDAAAEAEIPCIWIIHESLDPRLYYSFNWPNFAREALDCFSKAYAVVFVSHGTKALFSGALSPRVLNMVIHTGIPLEPIDAFMADNPREKARAELGIKPTDTAITMIGSTHPIKGQHVFLNAAKELISLSPGNNLSFFVAGGLHGFYFQMLDEIRSSFDPYGEKVHLDMFSKSVGAYYRASDILVCASFNESFPLVILEGMAYGLPIVSTPVVGIPEQIQDENTGLFFQPGNVSSLTEKLQRLINAPQLRKELGDRAFKRVRELFAIEKMVNRYWDLFRHAADKARQF